MPSARSDVTTKWSDGREVWHLNPPPQPPRKKSQAREDIASLSAEFHSERTPAFDKRS